MEFKWFGTASLSIGENKNRLLIDPFFNRNPDLFQPSLEKFASYDTILVTHGHFDHIEDIPKIYEANPNVKIYCTQIAKKTMMKHGIDESAFVVIKAGDTFHLNGFEIDVYQGKHMVIDFPMIIDGALKLQTYVKMHKLVQFSVKTFTYPENGEIVNYHIKGENDDIFVMGSLGYDENTKYPTNVSNLVLPYQGNSHIFQDAPGIIQIFNPKTVILDHCDDAFPPQSANINTDPLINKMNMLCPEMNIFRPIAGARYHLNRLEGVEETCNVVMWDKNLLSLA